MPSGFPRQKQTRAVKHDLFRLFLSSSSNVFFNSFGLRVIRGLRLKLEMGKLSDDIAPYHLRTRQLSKESLLLNQREEKLFKSTAAGTPEGS